MLGLRPAATSRMCVPCDDLLGPPRVDVHADRRRSPPRRFSTLAPSRMSRPSARKCLQHHRGQLRIVLAERLQAFEHGDAAAEPQVRLRHLHADRAAADDDQVLELARCCRRSSRW